MGFKEEHYLMGVFAVALAFAIGISIGFYIYSGSENQRISSGDFFDSELIKSIVHIPGVDNRGIGISAILETNVRTGSGFVLVNINDLTAGSSTQNSARAAARAAKNYLDLGEGMSFDVIYNIKTDVGAIDGPSAGAAMAVSLISLLENRTLNDKVSITGFVTEDGTIGPASGIEQKASALRAKGIEVLLVSDQVALPREYIRGESCSSVNGREYCEVNYISQGEIDVSGVKVIPVGNLEDAMEYFYK